MSSVNTIALISAAALCVAVTAVHVDDQGGVTGFALAAPARWSDFGRATPDRHRLTTIRYHRERFSMATAIARHTHVLILSAVTVVAVAVAACSSSGSGTPTASTSAGSTAPAAAQGMSVLATETEFHIALGSTSFKAGTYTFDVKNAGKLSHALTIDGPGVADKSTGDISPGSSATMTVTLKAGRYDIFCPVGNHKMLGMEEKVQVDR